MPFVLPAPLLVFSEHQIVLFFFNKLQALSFPGAQTVKNLPTMQTWSLGLQDPLEKEMATHSSILA